MREHDSKLVAKEEETAADEGEALQATGSRGRPWLPSQVLNPLPRVCRCCMALHIDGGHLSIITLAFCSYAGCTILRLWTSLARSRRWRAPI